MRIGFYPKIAWQGIRKNKRLYLPYILTCIGMAAMYYIISFLATSPMLTALFPHSALRSMLELGSVVIAVFSTLFLFYTNSFLVRRRKKEFGLYNILGMDKRNIGVILFFETLLVAFISLAVGLTAGVALSKLAELMMVNLLHKEIDYAMSISWIAIRDTIVLFLVIDALIFLNTLRQVHAANPIALLHSENTGEKAPKANWFLGLAGIALLGGAYYIAVTITDPLKALIYFFVAVLMVIVATVLLFTAGSVLLCRILRGNKKYYYHPKHFVSVSSMAFRMKRNGSGLATICILCTMVLVIVATTTCCYFGAEDNLHIRYPRDVNLDIRFQSLDWLEDERVASLRAAVDEVLDNHGVEPLDIQDYRTVTAYGKLNGNELEWDASAYMYTNETMPDFDQLRSVYVMPLADYNRTMNREETLAEGEALLYTLRCEFPYDTLTIRDGATFRIVRQVDEMPIACLDSADIASAIYLVVPDIRAAVSGLENVANFLGDPILSSRWVFAFSTDASTEFQMALQEALSNAVYQRSKAVRESIGDSEGFSVRVECLELEREDYFDLFGGLFFLGVMLSIVFCFASVLIIYYKQVSEGYEDQARFEIMQKVGMTKRDIRRSINSQMLTVFLAPLVMAVIHLCFAFPILKQLLSLLNARNEPLLLATTGLTVLLFAILYALVYRVTTGAYYHIVSGARED